jgi:pSer/pThr/pTyr-binding forkhead associated (FHA) protein
MKNQGFVFHIQEQGHNGYDFFYHRADPREYLIGRSVGDVGFDSVQVQLQNQSISRIHCRIFWHPYSGWLVEDMGSTNGTWIQVDGGKSQPFKRVKEPVPIDPYSVIRVGNTELSVRAMPMRREAGRKRVDTRQYERIYA